MLDLALTFLKDEINSYLISRTGSDAVKVAPSNLVDATGKIIVDDDSIAAAVINIEEERTLKEQRKQYSYQADQHVVRDPHIKVNLSIMFAANFKLYDQALKYISYVLTFFQSHPSFTVEKNPSLDPGIIKLTPELQTLTYEELNQIWAFIGGKHIPSIVYKVRVLAIQDQAPINIQPPITIIKTDVLAR